MDTFLLPPPSGSGPTTSRIEIALPTSGDGDGGGGGGAGAGAAQLTEAAVQAPGGGASDPLAPDSLGRALASLTADVPPESGAYCAALAQACRHLDARPTATVGALCPRLLEQAVRGRSARLRANATALLVDELLPRSEEATRLFVAQFCRALQPAETDRSAMLAVVLCWSRQRPCGAWSAAPRRGWRRRRSRQRRTRPRKHSRRAPGARSSRRSARRSRSRS